MSKLAEVARRLNFAAGAEGRLAPLILTTDAARLPDPLPAARALPPGSTVILRHYELDVAARAELGRHLIDVCRPRNVRVLIAGDPAMARHLGADGVHFPEYRIRRRSLSDRLARRDFSLITAAAHSAAALRRAVEFGVDAVLLSPVLPTRSHPDARALGPTRFAALVRSCPVAVYGLGGIDGSNAARLFASGAAGIAGISGIAEV